MKTKSRKARTLYLYATSEDKFRGWTGGEDKEEVEEGIADHLMDCPEAKVRRIKVTEVLPKGRVRK